MALQNDPCIKMDSGESHFNVVVGRFYTALFSALEQTHCARMWFLHEWLAFFNTACFEYLTKWCTYALTWLVPRETAAVSAQVLRTPYNHAPCHFMQSHIIMDFVKLLSDLIWRVYETSQIRTCSLKSLNALASEYTLKRQEPMVVLKLKRRESYFLSASMIPHQWVQLYSNRKTPTQSRLSRKRRVIQTIINKGTARDSDNYKQGDSEWFWQL